MSRSFLLVAILFLLTTCKRVPFYELRLAPADITFTVADFQVSMNVLAARLHQAEIAYESMEYLPDAGQILVIANLTDQREEELRALLDHVDIGFWDIYRKTDEEVLRFMGALSAKSREKLQSMLSFREPGFRQEVFATTTDAAILEEVSDYLQPLLPEGMVPYWSAQPGAALGEEQAAYDLYIVQVPPRGRATLNQRHITKAEMKINEQYHEPQLYIDFDDEGTAIWGKMTEEAANDNNRSIAVSVNGRVIFAPRVMEPIYQGSSVLTGYFSVLELNEIAETLNSGSYPGALTVISIEERK